MSLRLLHTSDVHLGATFKVLGERGREQRRQLEATFARVVTLAIEERVSVLLIAGDLFDSASGKRGSPSARSPEITIRSARAARRCGATSPRPR